jgi:hypothetical protein
LFRFVDMLHGRYKLRRDVKQTPLCHRKVYAVIWGGGGERKGERRDRAD